MKKITVIFLAIFAALLTSCTLDEFFGETGLSGTTTVTFTPGFGTGDGGAATKAFAEIPQIENLYLAVYNEGGKALIEYVKAEPVNPAVQNSTKYSYTATLKTTSKPRVIHFIANAPEELGYGSDVDGVGNLSYSFDTGSWTGEDAYWGYLKLDNGICEETDPGFSSLEEALSDVRLVRNFAKIKVEEAAGSNFTITRFWISNFPDCSTAAPYNRNERRFETQYAAYTRVTTAMAAGYTGFCPASSGLVSLSGLDDTKLSAIACAPASFAYTYEREKPTDDPLCIIVGGTTSDLPGGDTETFYKVELRDNDGNYLPVLRNFNYTISIGHVSKVGEPTVAAALNSVASGAIDTDLSLQGLTDLSNGKSRIAVSETERVLFDSQPFELLYSFIPDITDGTVVNKTLAQLATEGYPTEADVRAAHLSYVTIGFESGLSGNVIESYEIAAGDEIDGYRKVSMTPVPTSDIIKNEVVTIIGHVWNTENARYETLQRTVNYQIRPRLEMTLTLTPDRIPMAIGTPISLTIGIEENLPKSLFTLDLKITSEQMTLTPGSNTLPISSEVGADGKPAFFMTRAITWEEYSSTPSVMDGDGILRKHFECPLKTNTSDFRDVDPSFGQGDKVYVSNVNFNTGTSFFIAGDDNLNRFINPHLDKEYLVAGRPANIIFGMTGLPSDGTIFVRMRGMEPVDASALEYRGEYPEDTRYSVYEMAVSNVKSESFAVRATSGSVQAYYQLFDDEFNGYAPAEIQIQTPDFTNLRFNYNNLNYVVAGKQAKAMFHMDYLPLDDAMVTIWLRNAVPVDGTAAGITDGDGYTSYQIAVTDNDFGFPVMISPASEGETTAYFKLTADNYVDSDVAGANIQKLCFSNLKLINLGKATAGYLNAGRPARIDFTLDDMPSDNVITIRLTNLTLGSGRSGVSAVTDNGGGSYDLTVTGTHVLLDVTPASVEGNASYELTDTEFNTGNCSAQIRKLDFGDLRLVNLNNTGVGYVNEGKPARIQFMMEEIPANGKVTLELTNLTLSNPATGSGFSSISGSDGVYELAVTGTTVTLDVTPAMDVESATFSLSNDEFYDAECITTVQKLRFTGLRYNINTGTDYGGDDSYLLAGDATSSISFNVEMLPEDGYVTVWIYNASINGMTPGETDGDDHTSYVVPVTALTTTLGITVNDDLVNDYVDFYLTDDEFIAIDSWEYCMDVKTRYTINWSDVQIMTDYPAGAAVSQTDIEVYHGYNPYSEDYFEKAATISTNGSGYASGESITVDSYDGEEEYYYFKFTRNGIDYKSETVTLAELAGGITVTGIAQKKEYTILARKLYFGEKANGGTGYVRFGSYDNTSGQISFDITSQGTDGVKGKNRDDIKVTCIPNTTVYFYVGGNKGYGPIDTFADGEEHSF